MRGAAAIAVLVLCAAQPPRAEACASVVREGDTVRIVGEEALIVWDPVHHIEHFVRRADFATGAPSFGFLVPTPAVPTLSEADEGAFPRIASAVRPKTRTVRRWTLAPPLCVWTLMAPALRGAPTASAPPVRVLSQTRVAGLDAAVLEASDAAALAGWLRDHEYPSRPALERWLAPIVAARWTLAAFKVAKRTEPEPAVGLAAVRLTFAAEAPFYPYREPDDTPELPGRSLRVALVTPGRMEGRLGGPSERTPWAATLEYARPLANGETLLAGALPPSLIPDRAWLSTFVDTAARRPAQDLFFTRAPVQDEVVPPPVLREDLVEIPFPAEPLLLSLALWLYLRRRRRKLAQGG